MQRIGVDVSGQVLINLVQNPAQRSLPFPRGTGRFLTFHRIFTEQPLHLDLERFWHQIPTQGHNSSLLDSVLTKAPDPLLPNGLQGASSSLLEELIREASASAPSHLNTIGGEALVQGINHFFVRGPGRRPE